MSTKTTKLSKETKEKFKAPASLGMPIASEKTPPHSIEAEQALIGACILEGGQESITLCIEAKLPVEAFYKPAHQIIFKALLELYEASIPVDDIILSDKLQAKNQLEEVGGHAYLNIITNKIDTPAHLTYYLHRVRDTYLLRRLIQVSVRTVEQAYSQQENLNQFLEQVEQEVFRISEDRISDAAKPLKHSIDSAVNLVNMIIQRKGELTGLPSGFVDLDKLTFGLHPQEMIVVAARPSMGKTSLAINIVEAIIVPKGNRKPQPVLMFSLEMSAEQLAMRLLCGRAKVNMSKLKDGFASAENQRDLANTAKELKNAPFWIDDSGSLTILEMRAKARRMQAQLDTKLGLIIIDYLQLLSGTDPRIIREQQISEISRGIKAMAKELNVPVIVLSQLNRESEKEKRQPRLSDLRESGSIEQDADLVLLLSKAKDTEESEEDTGASSLRRDLIIAKQRNGPTGIVPLTFVRHLTRFENYIQNT